MKWDCGRRRARLKRWHRWFAWYPVKMGPRDCRWLEVVERKGTLEPIGPYLIWEWEWDYREAKW